jgi:hypothetical protein
MPNIRVDIFRKGDTVALLEVLRQALQLERLVKGRE